MSGLEELSCLLDKQTDVQKKLLAVEKRKTEVLTHGDTAALDSLLKEEQPLVMYSSTLERQRETLQNTLGLGGVTLRQIAASNDKDGSLGFQSRFEELKSTVEKLRKTAQMNKAILQTRMYVINEVLALGGIEGQDGIYTKEGRF